MPAQKSIVSGILEQLPGGFTRPDEKLQDKETARLHRRATKRGIFNVLDTSRLTPGEKPPEVVVASAMAGGDALTPSAQKLQKSLGKLLDGPDDSIERLAFERDPQRIAEFAGIWRPKLQLIPDNLLKRMAIQDDLVAAVVHTRCNHVAQFGRQQQDRHQKGFKFVIDPSVEESLTPEQKDALQERIDRAENLLLTCGHTKGWSQQDRCSFTEYLYMSSRNAIVLGRMATEIIYVPNPRNPQERIFHSFRATDAGTIYYAAPYKDAQEAVREQARHLLESIKNEKLKPEKFENDEYSWVQVIDGRPLQAFTSDEMLVQNFYPLTDIELQGYPLTPLDTAISAVTTHINITNHNKLYFQYGRAARGMLVIKSQDVDAEVVQSVKQQFNASINAVHNCLAGDTQIITDQGQVTLEGFLNGAETRMTRLWTGTSWQPAMVYRVEEKKELCSIETANGLKIECSPNHRFWTIGDDGEPGWKIQKDIREGDFVAVNKKEASNPDMTVSFMGKPMTEDMMEVLGWMTGDGTLGQRGIRLFYHHVKERDIWSRHGEVLRSYGLSAVNRIREISEEEKATLMERHGFKSIASERIWIDVNSADVALELRRLGFTNSSREEIGKTIPGFVYAAPSELKAAFLRGFFSADGNNAKGLSPAITICNDRLRKQTRSLLMSMGIRCTLSEGKTKNSLVAGGHKSVLGQSVLRVKDRALFFEKVGFLQAHKQPRAPRGTNKGWGTSNGIAHQTVLKYLRIVKDKTKLPRGGNDHNVGLTSVFTRRQHMDIDEILRGEHGCSLSRLLNYMTVAGVEIPAWMTDFNYEPVVNVTRSSQKVRMYDTTVYNPGHECAGANCQSDQHSLMTGSFLTHQSWRMPVFGIGPEDDLSWVPIDQGQRDMEFQYLSDSNARTIMAAFQMSPEELPGYQHLSRGTNNQALCLSFQALTYVPEGLKTIEEILDGAQEKRTKVWTGTAWRDARVFVTGDRQRAFTTLWNGSRLETSPDHRFRAVDIHGQPAWVPQRNLKAGDRVLVNRKPVEGTMEPPSYNGRPLTSDMMEVLGWLTGDGNISIRFTKSTGNVKQGVATFFYHHEKERDIWERHSKVLAGFGLNHRHVERVVGEREAADAKERYGFKSIAPTRLTNRLYDTSFVKWLLSLGFKSSTDGKVIPAFVHVLPIEYRQAFLRGLFSADGTCMKAKSSAARIVIHSDTLRHQTRDLLLGLGIRTQLHEGLKKQHINGPNREMVDGASVLAIKDKARFYEMVGFLQPHKQPEPFEDLGREDRIPSSVVGALLAGHASELRSEPNAPRAMAEGCSRIVLERMLTVASVEMPSWLNEHYIEEVVSVEATNEVVSMADVEVFDSEHAFIANGMVVHNSETQSEWKLTAARDVGIRPMIAKVEDFLNDSLLPLLDPELAKYAKLRLVGLDIEDEEKESVRLQQDMAVHMTYDEVLQKVEKKPLGKENGGYFPLNANVWALIEKYMTFGEILEKFRGVKGAGDPQQHPEWAFFQNEAWMKMQELQAAQAQAQQQAQQPQPSQPPPGGQPPPGPGQQPADGGDLSAGVDQLAQLLGKSEGGSIHASRTKLRAQQKATNDKVMEAFRAEAMKLTEGLVDLADQHKPRGK